ncbi:hypothetical protein Tco_0605566 [Tanacetum coccineum]
MIPLTVPSPITTPVTAKSEKFLTELGAQVKMQGGLFHDHAVRLEELSSALFERYGRDIGELFTRSGRLGMRFSPREERRAQLELVEIVDNIRRGHSWSRIDLEKFKANNDEV